MLTLLLQLPEGGIALHGQDMAGECSVLCLAGMLCLLFFLLFSFLFLLFFYSFVNYAFKQYKRILDCHILYARAGSRKISAAAELFHDELYVYTAERTRAHTERSIVIFTDNE